MAGSGAADSRGGGSRMAASGGARNSLVVVDEEKGAAGTLAVALGFRTRVAARGNDCSPDSGRLSQPAAVATALLLAGDRGRAGCRRQLDSVAGDPLVPAPGAQPR